MIDVTEAMRYLKMSDAPDDAREQVEQVASMLESRVSPNYLYKIYPLDKSDIGILLRGTDILLTDRLSNRVLKDCHSAAVLVCTLGFAFDNLLRSVQARSMADAVILDACGSVYVEQGCDCAQNEILKHFSDCYAADRFSPGYVDLPLDIQVNIMKLLDAEKHLGVHLTDSMMFNPTKTVSAFIGISDNVQAAKIRGCSNCVLRETCEYRKVGKLCD